MGEIAQVQMLHATKGELHLPHSVKGFARERQHVLIPILTGWHPLNPLLVCQLPRSAAMHVFVFNLEADDGTAVGEQQPLRLPADLAIQPLHTPQIGGIVGAHLERLAIQPVGQAAVADVVLDAEVFINATRIVAGRESKTLRDAVMCQIQKQSIVLDVSDTTAIDASGLGTLLFLHTCACSVGSELKLLGLSKHVLNVLELTQLLYVFDDDIVVFELATLKEVDRIALAKPEYPGASPYRLQASDDPNDAPGEVTAVVA